MGKVLVIMDNPKSCKKCQMAQQLYDNEYLCVACNKRFCMGITQKQDFCPLVEIPQKDTNSYYPCEYSDGHRDGWNMCIDRIMGKN